MQYAVTCVGMQALDVRAADSHDENGASRFHALSVNRFVVGNFPSWYKKYDSYGAKSVSDSLLWTACCFYLDLCLTRFLLLGSGFPERLSNIIPLH